MELEMSKKTTIRFFRRRWTRAGLVALLLASSAPVATSRAEDGVTTSGASQVDPRAMEVVQRMAERIVAAERIRLGGEVAWDVVQSDGQTLEFGATREVVLQRPDHLRVDIDLREGGRRRLLYDGKQIVFEDLEHNVYASDPRTGPVDEMVEFVSDRFGIPVALSEFLSPDLSKLLGENLESASHIGESTIDGVRCDHVALRNGVGGMQLWVARDDSLPRRITITYEHEEGRPQFRARLTGWDLSPDVTEATFAFDPPKDAEKIAFAPRPTESKKEGSK
jgi:hypothetical protein